MAEHIFMKVDEVQEVLGVSESLAYKIIRQMNAELKSLGCITISGRIDHRFFYDKLYGMRKEKEDDNGGIQG